MTARCNVLLCLMIKYYILSLSKHYNSTHSVLRYWSIVYISDYKGRIYISLCNRSAVNTISDFDRTDDNIGFCTQVIDNCQWMNTFLHCIYLIIKSRNNILFKSIFDLKTMCLTRYWQYRTPTIIFRIVIILF